MVNSLSAQEIKHELVDGLQQYGVGGAITKDSTQRMINVIQGYGEREGIFDSLAGLAYRIWNAVKSIFGSSDWQIAKRAIATDLRNDFRNDLDNDKDMKDLKDMILKINESNELLPKEKKEIMDNITGFHAETANNMAESMLQLLINSTYEKNYETKDDLHMYLNEGMEKLYKETYIEPTEKFLDEKLKPQIEKLLSDH